MTKAEVLDHRRRNKKYYQRHRKEVIQSVLRYTQKLRKEQPRSYILKTAKINARQRGIDFRLTLKDIPEIPKTCSVLGMTLRYARKRTDSTPSLDRIDNSLGYVKGNIRIISLRANTLKSDASDVELIALGQDAEKRLLGEE